MSSIKSLCETAANYPVRAPVIIAGVLRERETANIIAAPKTGKTWLMIQLAISLALGRDWLGKKVAQKKVLVVDNELHPSELTWRYQKVADAMGVSFEDLEGKLYLWSQRGNLKSITDLADYFLELQQRGIEVILLDAFYRAMPAEAEENSNNAMTQIYNTIDNYAQKLNTAFILVHHTTKGKQREKATTDVGSGAGSIARASDAHLTLLPHPTDPGVIEVRGVARSFAPLDPFQIKQDFPLWHRMT